MYTCDHCKKAIKGNAPYPISFVAMQLYNSADGYTSIMRFHLSCFKDIAGDEYLNELQTKLKLIREDLANGRWPSPAPRY